jgi:hypothetical protein
LQRTRGGGKKGKKGAIMAGVYVGLGLSFTLKFMGDVFHQMGSAQGVAENTGRGGRKGRREIVKRD